MFFTGFFKAFSSISFGLLATRIALVRCLLRTCCHAGALVVPVGGALFDSCWTVAAALVDDVVGDAHVLIFSR
jgi:hypothetical protein